MTENPRASSPAHGKPVEVTGRVPYTAPRLTSYGSLAALTRSGMGSSLEGGMTNRFP